MMTDYYMMVSIWYVLFAIAGNRKDTIKWHYLSVMVAVARLSFYGLSS